MDNSFTVYITVFFKNWKGERVEIPCSSVKEAKHEQEKLRQVGLYSWIDWSAYIPSGIVGQICEQMEDLYE